MFQLYAILIIFLISINFCISAKYEKNRDLPVSDLRLDNLDTRVHRDFIAFPQNTDVHRNYYHNHHHHHYYPDYPYDQDYDDQEDKTYENGTKLFVSQVNKTIPITFIQKFNAYDNVNDLLINFVDEEYEARDPIITNRFGEQERNAAIIPKSAACLPELQTIRIAPPNTDPSTLYIPTCTRIERCGGCCSHSLLSCQAKEVETVPLQVIKTEFTGSSKLKYVAKEIILVEKHKKCKCDCKVKAADCHKLQTFRQSECRCVCANTDEEKKCYKNNDTKLWNPDICACQCRETQHCSTGYRFDLYNCKCVLIPMRRRYAEERTDKKTIEQSVIPLDDDFE